VGIMLYNSASFMGVPWETIIKIYRKELGERSFPTLKGYQEDFIGFLKANGFYCAEEDQIRRIQLLAEELIHGIVIEVLAQDPEPQFQEKDFREGNFLMDFSARLDSAINQLVLDDDPFPEFQDYSLESFTQSLGTQLGVVTAGLLGQIEHNQWEILMAKIIQYVFLDVRNKRGLSDYTGLVFTGFGDKEIYPQLIAIKVSFAVGDRLRYFIDEEGCASISNSSPAAICPFAQTDVIYTILAGMDPTLENVYLDYISHVLNYYNGQILQMIGNAEPRLSQKIASVDFPTILQEISEEMLLARKREYIEPLMLAVSTLSKEDLAEMAESLIYLTYLKRRITFAEESVGGPVDVAIISKGDGFVWIKRKHYFDPKLNPGYFATYYSS
jgi:hypothetical protein